MDWLQLLKRSQERYGQTSNDVTDAVEHGTLITVVWGVKTLGRVALTDKKYSERIFPFLIEHLTNCIPQDLLLHAKSILPSVDSENKNEFLAVLDSRKSELKSSQLARHKKLLRSLEAKQLHVKEFPFFCKKEGLALKFKS